jgi:flagellar motor protein MotB
MARRKEAHGGGHGWFVTFADLMGLLVSFFVMLVAFSNQDAKKVQAVAGSMQQAFGVQKTPNDELRIPQSNTRRTSDLRIHPLRRHQMRRGRTSITTEHSA